MVFDARQQVVKYGTCGSIVELSVLVFGWFDETPAGITLSELEAVVVLSEHHLHIVMLMQKDILGVLFFLCFDV